jgi:hypothetical protein
LDKAELKTLGRDENDNLRTPFEDNLPFAGFALIERHNPDGKPYYVPSNFSTSSTDSYWVMHDIVNWLNNNHEMSSYNNDLSFEWFYPTKWNF